MWADKTSSYHSNSDFHFTTHYCQLGELIANTSRINDLLGLGCGLDISISLNSQVILLGQSKGMHLSG